MFEINLNPNEQDLAAIKKLPNKYKEGLVKGIRRAMLYAEGKAKRRFNTPGNLKVRTGHYRRSIRSGVKSVPGAIDGYLTANVIYAAIHETGGTIYPKKGKYLKFPIKGKWVSVKKVVIPKRPLMTPAVAENINRISKIIISDIIKEVE